MIGKSANAFRGRIVPRSRPAASTLLVAGLAFLVVWPSAMLVLGAFRTAPLLEDGAWSLTAAYDGIAADGGIGKAIWSSLLLAVSTTVLSLVLGGLFAFLGERTDARLRRLVLPLMVVSFATPLLFQALGFVLATNERIGLVDQGLRLVLGGQPHLFSVASMGGLIAISTVHGVGFAYLFLRGPVRALNGAHHEASRVSGAGRLQTFRRIDLPLLTPALTGVAMVLFVVGLGIFDSVQLLARDEGLSVLGTKVYHLLNGPVPPEYASACLIAIGLLVVVGLATGVQRLVLGRHRHTTVSGKGFRAEPVALGRGRWVADGAIALYGAVFVVLPFAALLVTALQPYPGVYHSFTLDWFRKVLDDPDIAQAARTTSLLAVVGGAGAMTLAFGMAYVRIRTTGWRVNAIRGIAFLPLAMPGIVVALAVLWAYVSVPGLRETYGTVWIICVASMILALPFAYQAADAALSQVAPELEEAARVSGASAPRAALDVVVRLLLPTFVAGWFVSGLVIAGSLQVPLLLSGPGTKTFSVLVAEYYRQGRLGEASALIVVQLVAIVALLALARLVSAVPWRALRARLAAAPPSIGGPAHD